MNAPAVEFYTHDPIGVVERYAAWASGERDEDFGFAVGVTKSQCGEVAEALYDLHVMEFYGSCYAQRARTVKEWAYTVAAEFASTNHRTLKCYALPWGRQAARDGVGIAMWKNLYGMGVDITARADKFGIARRSYAAVRDHVYDKANHEIAEFARVLDLAMRANLD